MIDYNSDDFIAYLKTLKFNKLKGKKYIDSSCSFDIETTRIAKESFMYLWGFSFFNKFVKIGRTWEEFLIFFNQLQEDLKQADRHIIIYVHNLNHEYSFMYEFIKDLITDYFAKGERDILYFKTSNTWWRCSAKLTRLSLDKSCVMYNTAHQKLVGELDYNIIRYPWTELTESEMNYFMHDLITTNEVVESVKIKKQIKGLVNMPMTLTGFIRKRIKKNCESVEYHMSYKTLKIDNEIYSIVEDAAKGGSCEASIFKKNKIISDVDCFDYNSQHIYIMLCEYFPMSAFKRYYGDMEDLEKIYKLMNERCCIFDVVFDEIGLKKDKDFGIIGTSHILNKKDAEIEIQIDFRVIKAKNIMLSLNELDFFNILKFYDFKNVTIRNLYWAYRARLPWQFRDEIWKIYNEKLEYSQYKGTDFDYLYQNKKQELNSISGMIQTRSIMPTWIKCKDGHFQKNEMSNADRHFFLNDYSKSYSHFVYYPWGLWIQSHSRTMCYNLIDCCSGHIYHDTDSCYATNFDLKKLKKMNKQIERKAARYGYNSGQLGQATIEHENVDLKVIGLKQYAFKEDGQVKITIAGIPKDCGKYLNNDLNNLKLGFKFPNAMKTATYYSKPIEVKKIDGHEFLTAGGCCIKDEDFIIRNFDSKMDLLEGYIYEE